jgi:hypothetical protein
VAPEARAASALLAGAAAAVGASILPFWPAPLVVALALGAGGLAVRFPRVGLAIALATPVFPLGNVAEAAALVYAALALGWLALMWRDARAGLAFCAGPLLAPVGLLGLLPLLVQPASGFWRRGLHAFAGVLGAAAVAGLHGRPLPLTGTTVTDLGVTGSEHPVSVVDALVGLLRSESALLTTGLALAIAAMVLPIARNRGLSAIAALGLGQVVLVLAWAPEVPWPGIVLSTALAVAVLAARPAIGLVRDRRR